MTDTKMTDDKIIEGLTRWAKSFDGIATDLVWITAALDLINRLTTDNESLKQIIENLEKELELTWEREVLQDD